MKMLHLSELENHILYLALMDASQPVIAIAKRLGTKPHLVQAALSKFRREGLIVRRALIDISRLGFFTHELFISLSNDAQQSRAAILDYLINSPWIGSILEVGGEYDLMLTVRVRHQREMADFQADLSERFPGALAKKDTSLVVESWFFGEKFLVADPSLYKHYHLPMLADAVTVDDIDRRILFEIGDTFYSSLSALARNLGMPLTTVEYRVKKLTEKTIIRADMHELRGAMIGLSYHVFLVSMKSLSESMNQEFCEAARLNPRVPWISRGTGHWDYVMGIAFRQPAEAHAAVEQFRQRFGNWLSSYRILPMFRAPKVRDYPMDPAFEAQIAKNNPFKSSNIA